MRLWQRLLRRQAETIAAHDNVALPDNGAPLEPWLQSVPTAAARTFLAGEAEQRHGRHSDALRLYNAVRKDLPEQTPAIAEFLAILEIRIAATSVGLRRYKEAQRHLEQPVVRSYVKGTRFAPEHLYDYWSTMAQVRGAVGDEEGMLVACTNGLHIAWGVLGDPGRAVDTWRILFEVLMHGGGWGQILERTAHAQSFAQGLPRQPKQRLLMLVERWQAFAYQQLGQREEARRHAHNLLADAQRRGDQESAALWEAFIAGLG